MQSSLSWRSGRQFNVSINHDIDGKCNFFSPAPPWFWLLLSMTKNNLGRKGIFHLASYRPSWRQASAGTQDRSLQQTTEGCCLLACSQACIQLSSTALYRDGISQSGRDPSASAGNQENTSQTCCPQANLMAAIPQRRGPLPRGTKLITPAITNPTIYF